MKKIILLLTLLFTFSVSAQYNILSAVQLNEGQEDQYLVTDKGLKLLSSIPLDLV